MIFMIVSHLIPLLLLTAPPYCLPHSRNMRTLVYTASKFVKLSMPLGDWLMRPQPSTSSLWSTKWGGDEYSVVLGWFCCCLGFSLLCYTVHPRCTYWSLFYDSSSNGSSVSGVPLVAISFWPFLMASV